MRSRVRRSILSATWARGGLRRARRRHITPRADAATEIPRMSQPSRRVRGSSARTCVDLCARWSLIECLEPRRMLAAEFVNGTWTITGDEAGAPVRDRIVIRQADGDN